MKTTRRDFIFTAAGGAIASIVSDRKLSAPNAAGLTAKVVNIGGVQKIAINGEVFDPLAFRTFRPVDRNIREFYEAGVRLMCILSTGQNCTLGVPYAPFGEMWGGPRQYKFERFDRQMELFLKNAPNAYFNVMLQIDTKAWYLKSHPEYSDTYSHLERTAGDPTWRTDAAQFLRDAIQHVEEKYGNKVFAYSLMCGCATEWFTGEPGQPDKSPIEERCFQHYLGDKTTRIPGKQELFHTSNGVFRDPKSDRHALDYWRFRHEIVADAVLFFARQAQETIKHRKLLGVFGGYLNGTAGGTFLLHQGHLAFDRVYQSPDIDMIYSPAIYGEPRSFTGAGGHQVPVDSVELNNKVFFQEIDHRTYAGPRKVENGAVIASSDNMLKNAFEARMTLRREFMLTRIKRTGMWWFDFFGGSYYDPPLMKEVANMMRVVDRLKHVPMRSISQVAVFSDGPSMYFASGTALLNDALLIGPPKTLSRIGTPFDSFSFGDLENPRLAWEQYKLVIFFNAFSISEKRRAFIERRVKTQGRSILWLYAPGYIGSHGFSVDAMSDLVGIRLVPHQDAKSRILAKKSGLLGKMTEDQTFGFSKPVTPLFQISDPEATTLGVYAADGASAFGCKKLSHCTSYYCASGNVPATVYREIARAAGVHIFYEGHDPVYVNNRLIGIHMHADPTTPLVLPNRMNARLEELFDGGMLVATDGKCVVPREVGVAKLYLINRDISC